MERAVIDRIEDGRIAVLLVGREERVLDVSVEDLPSGAERGTWLRVELEGDALVRCEVDPEETEERRHRIREKLRRLRQDSPDS